MVRAAGAVQRDGQSHKLNVRLRAHWGCHDDGVEFATGVAATTDST
ncbi:hypothetical protein N9I33_01180 [Paracoccaceae bacterium]|nr:hypothetical protein [Paracoccaceae bacterium]